MTEPYKVTDLLTQDELLAGLAEEAAELGQAALKLRRVMNGKNPTPVSVQEAMLALDEEIADVELYLEQGGLKYCDRIRDIRNRKLARWIERLKDRESGG